MSTNVLTPHPTPSDAIVGETIYVAVSQLLLDGKNPRFFADLDKSDQGALAIMLAKLYDSLEIGQKIAREGYHAAEPPAVIASEDGNYIVVEGNRRVSALKGLTDPSLRARFENVNKWEDFAKKGKANGKLPAVIPVVLYPSREAANALLGARHIRGPKSWDAFQQGRFISTLIDSVGRTFSEAAEECNISVNEVKSAYRNYRLVSKDFPKLGVDPSKISTKYTVVGLVWTNQTLRKRAGVVHVSEVRAGQSMLENGGSKEEQKKTVTELLDWVVGSEKREPVLKDSRQVHRLGQVVAAEVGVKALRKGLNLDEAYQCVNDEGANPFDNALRAATAATNALLRATEQLEKINSEDQLAQLQEKADAVLKAAQHFHNACGGKVS